VVEIRVHGRGGQGAVYASNVLAHALFKEGKWVQAFPHFGVERRGAPVAAFVRFAEGPIELRCHIYAPDYVIILDPTLVDSPAVIEGLREKGGVLINSPGPPHEFKGMGDFRVATIDASSIAIKYGLGTMASPIVNTAILGAFARFSRMVSLEAINESVTELIKRKTDNNLAAVRESYENVQLPDKVQGTAGKKKPKA